MNFSSFSAPMRCSVDRSGCEPNDEQEHPTACAPALFWRNEIIWKIPVESTTRDVPVAALDVESDFAERTHRDRRAWVISGRYEARDRSHFAVASTVRAMLVR
jgi:hypothetical protein